MTHADILALYITDDKGNKINRDRLLHLKLELNMFAVVGTVLRKVSRI